MTKRVLITLCVLVFFIFTFFGCGSASIKEQNKIYTDFSADFTAEYREMKIEGRLNCNSCKMLNIELISPDSLSGLELKYKNSELQIIRDDMICSSDEAYIPECSFPNLLKNIISGISDGRAALKGSDDNINTYDLKSGYGNVLIRTDKSGKIISMELEDKQLKIQFINVKS